MATKSSATELTRLINQLRQERQHHLDSIAEIDQTFKEFGISSGGAIPAPQKGKPGPKPGRKGKRGRPAASAAASTGGKGKGAGKKKAGRKGKPGRKKGATKAAGGKPKSPWGSKFPMTGDELIINFIKDKGGATTEEIRKHWQTSGRKGKAENNLTNLVKSGKIKRNKLEGKPGSNYTLP